ARPRMADDRRDARLAHAVGVPRLHPRVEGRVRRGEAHLRRQPIGMVQRPHRVLPGVRPSGARAGHRLDGPRAVGRRTVRVLRSGRRSGRHRTHQQRLPAPRAARTRHCARIFRRARRTPQIAGYRRRMTSLRIAHIAPVATTIPPPKSGSVESMTSLLTEGLVARGHDVTLFATGDSTTRAKLVAIYPRGYWHDLNMWPWELYEMLNLAAAVERARDFDLIHYEAAY